MHLWESHPAHAPVYLLFFATPVMWIRTFIINIQCLSPDTSIHIYSHWEWGAVSDTSCAVSKNYIFIAVSRPTPHSSKFLNVMHKNCIYMHVDKDKHWTRIGTCVFSNHIYFLSSSSCQRFKAWFTSIFIATLQCNVFAFSHGLVHNTPCWWCCKSSFFLIYICNTVSTQDNTT